MADDKPFNVERVIELYKNCADYLDETGKVDLHKYCLCMREILKVFTGLGKAFSFAFADLETKTAHIEKVIKDENKNDIEVLIAEDRAKQNIIPNDSGEMTNCRALNRMAFVSLFVAEIFKLLQNSDEELKPILQKSYKITLELYHAWLVKKAVSAAFYVAPTRDSFLESLNVKKEEHFKLIPVYVTHSQKIVDQIKEIYEKNDLPWIFT